MATGNQARSRDGSIQVLSRSTQILRILSEHPTGLSLAKLSEQTGLPRSTIHRLLAALQVEGFVAPGPSGRMVLGPELLRLANGRRADLPGLVRPLMERLFEQLDETVDLAVLEDGHLRFIDQLPARHRLRAVSSVGATFPLHCTANGKAALAALGDEAVKRLLPARLERFTPNTISSRRDLLSQLAEIRATGLATDREEHTVGICAMGFLVGDPRGLHAAISVPVPVQRFEGREQPISEALKSARAAAEEVLLGSARHDAPLQTPA